jgi:hypothetical protein
MATSLLTRESDMLVFISYTRRLHMLNVFMFFIVIIIALIYGLTAADDSLFNGDKCIEDETHGSLGFLTWWMEWTLNDYPRGAGAFHEKNVTIINPWAQKATALNISRPSKLDVPQYWSGTDEGGGGWGILGLWRWSGVAMFSFLEPQDKESFETYKEFMHDHFELQGRDCFGKTTNLHLIVCIFSLGGGLVFMIFRSSKFWLRSAFFTEKCGSCCGVCGSCCSCSDSDPYDMSHIIEDFKQRKKVGQWFADRDRGKGKDVFIDLTTEVRGTDPRKETEKENQDAKDLEDVVIKKDFHELLLSNGLNLKTLQVEVLHCRYCKGTILVDLT